MAALLYAWKTGSIQLCGPDVTGSDQKLSEYLTILRPGSFDTFVGLNL
jgi:hypothetical protein